MKTVFTKEDIEFIKENYPCYGAAYCAKTLNKNRITVNTRARRLGLCILPKTYPTGTYKCSTCQEIKSVTLFGRDKSNKNGLDYVCKPCRKQNAKPLSDEDRIRISKNYHLRKEKIFKNPNLRRKFKISALRKSIKHRAKKHNLDFNLDDKWLDENIGEFCPVFNKRFVFFASRNNWSPYSPSVDRIDNNKGYTKDNCIVVSRKANTMKSSATTNEMIKLATFYNELQRITEDYSI